MPANANSNRPDSTVWQARAEMCELLAMALRYPDGTLAGAVASGEWAEAAREVASVLEVEVPCGEDDEDLAAGMRADEILHALRVEATRLFIGAPTPAVSPYESIWRAPEGAEAVLFVSKSAMAVERFCAHVGLGRPEGTNEPLDHIATELELLSYIAAHACAGDLLDNGTIPGDAYARFRREHLDVWAGRFCDALAARTRLPFYRAVAGLLGAFLVSGNEHGQGA